MSLNKPLGSLPFIIAIIISIGIHYGILFLYSAVQTRPSLMEQVQERALLQINLKSSKEDLSVKNVPTPIKKQIIEPNPKVKPQKIKKMVLKEKTIKKNQTVPFKNQVEKKFSKKLITKSSNKINKPLLTLPSSHKKNQKEQYLKKLIAHIQRYKFYPPKAQRRHIEGTVDITFDLTNLGNANKLKLKNAHRFLLKASQKAIQKALPLPKPPYFMQTPKTISFKMTYQLQN